MAMSYGAEGEQLRLLVPMAEVQREILNDLVLAVRESLGIDERILRNSCLLLCVGRDTVRLLPFGLHAENCGQRAQLCSSVLSRVSGLCNDCIRTVTDTRVFQHTQLTTEGLDGMRLVIYEGMLADRNNWEQQRSYQVPIELAAVAERYQTIGINPQQWLRSGEKELVHPMIVQQRRRHTLSGATVTEFIKTMRRLLSFQGNLQRMCVLCRRQMPLRCTK